MIEKTSPPPTSPMGLQTIAGGTRSADFRDIYTNLTRIAVTPWDFSITVSLAKEIIPGMPPISEDQAIIRMSPQQFKVFSQSMNSAITAWESVFGQITMNSPGIDVDKFKDGVVKMKEAVQKQIS